MRNGDQWRELQNEINRTTAREIYIRRGLTSVSESYLTPVPFSTFLNLEQDIKSEWIMNDHNSKSSHNSGTLYVTASYSAFTRS